MSTALSLAPRAAAADLPVRSALRALGAALGRSRAAVLRAEPGAGKTTLVPLVLACESWLDGQRIVMLEPRRLAARAAARRMAWLSGEEVGETVGYRVRFDSRIGPRTRIEVVTEAVLTRMLLDDPSLDGVGLVIFDEFHERSIAGDVGLALALESRAALRPELGLLIMSATIDGTAVARLLGDAAVIDCPGRVFPVETRHRSPRAKERLEDAVSTTILEALRDQPGDVLVFLPGAREIRRVAERLPSSALPAGVVVHRLHGMLDGAAQDAAIAASPPGTRKVVLSTSIAETSLTIEGVRVVIDCGLARVARFSPRTGMGRLETIRASRAEVDQRRGRAGRTRPGVCYRLWSEGEDAALSPYASPEIANADLAPLALDLAAAGVRDAAQLAWLDPPPAAALAQSRTLLESLDAVDSAGALTGHGKRLAALGLHPRLAHMAVRARDRGLGGLAADLIALLGDRDIARGTARDGGPDVDLRSRVDALHGRARDIEVDAGGLRRARGDAEEWRRRLHVAAGERAEASHTGAVLALAYPDRIAQLRGGAPGRFLLANGRGGVLDVHQPLAREPYLVVADIDDSGTEGRVRLAAPLDEDGLESAVKDHVETRTEVTWDEGVGGVVVRRVRRYRALVLGSTPGPTNAADTVDAVRAVWLARIAKQGLSTLVWSDRAANLRDRLRFLHAIDPNAWPDASDDALLSDLDAWVGPWLGAVRRSEDLARIDLGQALLARVDPKLRHRIDELAPERFEAPTGSRIAIDYSDPAAPSVSIRLQELFGCTDSPRLGGGRVPLVFQLLSPAHRPVQVTRDLAGFWRGTYAEVRKELRARYPKHAWPENPLAAAPQRGPRRRAR